MLESRSSRGKNVDDSGGPTDPLRAQPRSGVPVDDELLGLCIKPHGGLEGLEFIFGQPIFGAFPYPRGLGNVSVAVKGWKIFSHGCKLLYGHTRPPVGHAMVENSALGDDCISSVPYRAMF